jgi:carbon-monoxide dehydrogenase medium subunit
VFQYARPNSISEAIALLRDVDGARLLNGGTDLLVGLRKGTLRPPLVVDVKRATDLEPGIDERNGMLHISATTPLTQVIADERVRAHFPALVDAAQVVGSIQIRNRATLAGNVCNASPAADTATPLLVYDAVVLVVGPDGERRIPLDGFFVAPGRTQLAAGELVTAIELPLPVDRVGAAFARMTRRRGVDLATVNLCCAVSSAGATRFAFGAVGPRPFIVADESGELASLGQGSEAQERALRNLTEQATPISNVRASREYREQMLFVLSRRALERARGALRGDQHAG